MVGIPDHDVQEILLFVIQELVRLRHHLLVLPYHAPFPAVPIPPPWLEVALHLYCHSGQEGLIFPARDICLIKDPKVLV